MADRSKIEWTDASWNPIRARNRLTGKVGGHCERLSPGCANCYSESFNARLGTSLPFKPGHRADVEIVLDEKILLQPLRWARPRIIFVCSMTDLFADFVPDAVIDHVFAVMALWPQHTFQVLTKRSGRMRTYLEDDSVVRRVYSVAREMRYAVAPDPDRRPRAFHRVMRASASDTAWTVEGGAASDMFRRQEAGRAYPSWVRWPLPNVWLGVSAEDQRRADERVPDLLVTPAAVRFVSAEPLLGPINFSAIEAVRTGTLKDGDFTHPKRIDALTGWAGHYPSPSMFLPRSHRLAKLDMIIVGGESGRKARPMHPRWAQVVRDQCAPADVAFFFKQWGELLPAGQEPPHTVTGDLNDVVFMQTSFFRVGKKVAGRLLDGVEHNGMPQPAPARVAA